MIRRLVRGERGAALVEFAVGSMVFFLTVFGCLDYGLLIWRYNLVSDLAQEGARYASVHGASSASPASAANVQAFIDTRALGHTVTVTTSPAPSTLSAGSTVTCVVASTYTPITPLVPRGARTVSATARMIVSR